MTRTMGSRGKTSSPSGTASIFTCARKIAQVVEECGLEHRAAGRGLKRGEVVDILGRKAQVLDELGQLGGAAHDGIGAAKGMVAVKRGKTTLLIGLAALPQALGHSELVQIGEHCNVGGMRDVGQSHGATFRMCVVQKLRVGREQSMRT